MASSPDTGTTAEREECPLCFEATSGHLITALPCEHPEHRLCTSCLLKTLQRFSACPWCRVPWGQRVRREGEVTAQVKTKLAPLMGVTGFAFFTRDGVLTNPVEQMDLTDPDVRDITTAQAAGGSE